MIIGTPYEQITAPEYWEQEIVPVPELGRVAMWGDERSANSTAKHREIEETFTLLSGLRDQVRTLMVTEGEGLPAPEDFGLVRVILDERRRREGQLGHNSAPADFNQMATDMQDWPWYLGAAARITVPGNDDHHFEVTRLVVYARAARSGRQLVGKPSAAMGFPPSGQNLLIPRFTVGSTYRDEVEGVQRDRRVVQAHLVTPLTRVQNDRPEGGEKNPARGWAPRRQFSLGGSLA